MQICVSCNNGGVTDDPALRDGLRERKKRATRRALHDAALRLALERGLEHVTVEEISAAADVSCRTFFNYFTSKDQAVIGDVIEADEERVLAIMLAADTVPAGLREVAVAMAAEVASERDHVLMRWRLMERYPALLSQMLARFAAFEQTLGRAVAARTGEPADAPYPQLMAAVAGVSLRVAVTRWTSGQGGNSLEYHLNEVFGVLDKELAPIGGRARTEGEMS
jgi:AcrR family transcriptional regulator